MIVENKLRKFKLQAFSYFLQFPFSPSSSALWYSDGKDFSLDELDGL